MENRFGLRIEYKYSGGMVMWERLVFKEFRRRKGWKRQTEFEERGR